MQGDITNNIDYLRLSAITCDCLRLSAPPRLQTGAYDRAMSTRICAVNIRKNIVSG